MVRFNFRDLISESDSVLYDSQEPIIMSSFAETIAKEARASFSASQMLPTSERILALDAIKAEPDFFLLVGHMPVYKDNCE